MLTDRALRRLRGVQELAQTIMALALVAIAVVQYRHATARPRSAPLEPLQRARPRHPGAVFVPLACGVATSFDGLTEPCCRRRNHLGRCRTEAEIEHLAEIGGQSVVVPLAKPDEVDEGLV